MDAIIVALAYVGAAWIVWAVYRAVRAASPFAAAILLAGVALRIVLGVGLFSVLYWHLSPLRSLQSGGGFWALAIDAESYFNDAVHGVAAGGPWTVSAQIASPAYVRLLAAALEVFGVSPITAVTLNVLCYVAVVGLVVHASRGDRTAGSFAATAATISPALLIFGTQALKETFCLLIVAMALAGMRLWSAALDAAGRHRLRYLASGAALLALPVMWVAAVRFYYAVYLIGAVAAAGVAALAFSSIARWKIAAAYAVLLPLLWIAFARGAESNYRYYALALRHALLSPSAPMAELDTARTNFIATGGNTSIGEGSSLERADPGLPISRTPGAASRLHRFLLGAAVLLAPISTLRAIGAVTFSGGRGLLLVTDVDTIVMDILLVAALWLAATRWRRRPECRATIVFAVVLATVTAATMAYVVTNFGTLFRLRLIAVTPIWLLPAFLQRPGDVARLVASARPARARRAS